MDHVNWARTRDILLCIICIGIICWATFAVFGLFVNAITILILGLAVAFLISPLVDIIEKSGLPRALAALLVYIIVLALLGALGYLLIFSLIQQAVDFSDTINKFAEALPTTFGNFIAFLQKQGIPSENIHVTLSQIQGYATQFAQSLATNALNFLFILTNAFLNILLVLVLSFYFTVDGQRIRGSLLAVTPKRFLRNALLFEDALNRVVGNYIRGQLTLALLVGICTSLICITTGLSKYALICGVLAFLFETIPMVGPALASIAPMLLSLLLPDPFPRTFVVIGLFILLQALESNILGPRIVGHAVGLHPVAAILALLIGAQLFGVFGALLATPVVAALWVVVASIYSSARGESPDEILARKRTGWPLRRASSAQSSSSRPLPEDRPSETDGSLHDKSGEVTFSDENADQAHAK